MYKKFIVMLKWNFSEICSFNYPSRRQLLPGCTILKHSVCDNANVCATSNIVTATMRSPSPAKGSNEPSVRILVSYEWQWFLFWCTSRSSCDELCGRGEKRNFAPVLRVGHPPSLEGTSNEVDSDQLNFVGSIAFRFNCDIVTQPLFELRSGSGEDSNYENCKKIIKKEGDCSKREYILCKFYSLIHSENIIYIYRGSFF